jgi:hypothetical protein
MTTPNYDQTIEKMYHPENYADSSFDDIPDYEPADPDIEALLEAGMLDDNPPFETEVL